MERRGREFLEVWLMIKNRGRERLCNGGPGGLFIGGIHLGKEGVDR